MGASAAIGAAKWAGGKSTKMFGKGLDAMTGGQATKFGQKMSAATGRTMERLGLKAQGTTAQATQKDMKESSDRISGMDEQSKTRIAVGGAVTAQGRKDKVTAIMDKIKSGKISDLGDTAQQNTAIAYAESYMKGRGLGFTSRKDAEKLNPELAKYNEETTNKIKAANPGWSDDQVKQEAVKQRLIGMNPQDARKISAGFFKSADNRSMFVDSFGSKSLGKIIPSMSQEHKNNLRPSLAETEAKRNSFAPASNDYKEYDNKLKSISNGLA